MAFNSSITRTGASALVPESVSSTIIQSAVETSAVLRLATRLRDMATNQERMPVLSAMPTAYFVQGDTGLKQTSSVTWENKYIYAEEIAVIVPIPENVLSDAKYDIWGEVQPRIREAIGALIDSAVLFGSGAPDSWPDDIVTGATAAGNTVTLGANADVYDDILSENGTVAQVEADGFMVNGHVAAISMRGRLRGLRTADGQPIFVATAQEATRYQLDGEPVEFSRNGSFNNAGTLMVSGDWSQLVYSIRQDMTWKILDQAVLQDAAGNIILNLAQQDAVALRAVMRMGWALPNPVNLQNNNANTRYPFAVLLSA
jgi:HK97 family phage major capsid protein